MKYPEFKDIKLAYERIKSFINKTPVLTSTYLNNYLETELYFKCENFQKVGAFKYRGATNSILQLSDEELKNGVTTHSSGNHAAALALAAKVRDIKAYIVMPENSQKNKKNAVADYGAEIFYCKSTLQAREEKLQEVVELTKAKFIHPFDNPNVIAGQGTCAYEFLNEITDLDYIVCPVGGGGLLSGTSLASKGLNPNIKVIAAEPLGANDAFQSFYSIQFVPQTNPQTIADGLRTSLSDMTFNIISKNVTQILTASEENIIKAMRMIWERMKIIVEPSSAVPLACLIENKLDLKNKKVGIIISGGNVDLKDLPF